MNSTDQILIEHSMRPTAVRTLVWQAVEERHETFTLADIEEALPHMDRSSIFRTLRLFAENHLLHVIDDGSGLQKYCRCRCEDEAHEGHVHFTCTRCGHTFCLEHVMIPHVVLPADYQVDEAEYVVKGLCPKCRQK